MESQHQSHQAAWRPDLIDLAICGVTATSIAIATAWFMATFMFVGAFS